MEVLDKLRGIARAVRAAGLLAALLALAAPLPAGGERSDEEGEAPEDEAAEPRFEGLRAIQYEYAPQGGVVVLEWRVANGRFDRIQVLVDRRDPAPLAGDDWGLRIEGLSPGGHQMVVKGHWSGGWVTSPPISRQVLTASPVLPVAALGCLYYGYDPSTRLGLLQIAWQTPEPPLEDPYVEFDVALNDRSGLVPAPDNAVTFERIPEGQHLARIIAVTEGYASPPVQLPCRAIGLAPPSQIEVSVGCEGGRGTVAVSYRVPRETRYDAVAVWVSGERGPEFRGYYDPSPTEIRLSEIPEKTVEIEIAGARFDRGAEEPYALSNLPGGPGVHVLANIRVNCEGRAEFRRGDASANGRVNISDAIHILTYLFFGGVDLPCPPAADVDGSQGVDLTDAVALLGYLFAGGTPPPAPGPAACGEDPTPAGPCLYNACGG